MSNTLLEEIDGSAQFSPCGNFRYLLTRSWGDGPHVAWLMLNPSKAGALEDDPTIFKVTKFSRHWGYGSFSVFNLASHISTDPKRLQYATDPVGPLADYWAQKAIEGARELICAWGCADNLRTPILQDRPKQLLTKIRNWKSELVFPFNCLGINKDGSPKHPLYVSPLALRKPYAP